METTSISRLHLPRPALGQCILAAFERDTRGAALAPHDRYNYFAASPLCAVSVFFDGAAYKIESPAQFDAPWSGPLYPAPAFSGPQSRPLTSWNPGEMHGLIVVFYPDAVTALTGLDMRGFTDRTLAAASPELAGLGGWMQALQRGDALPAFEALQDHIEPHWADARPQAAPFGHSIRDWNQSLALRAALSPSGQSLRQLQRRIKRWTGQSLRGLHGYSKSDEAFEMALNERGRGALDIAGIAACAGFADQSHMGRVVRAQTGFSPSELMQRLEQDEAFWIFRLMGMRY